QLSEVRRQESDRLRMLAELREQESTSLALAANARNLINDAENNLGLALAIAAYEANPSPLADVQQTLARAVYGPGARYRLRAHQTSVLDVAFSTGGSTAYSASADGTIGIWNLTDGTLANQIVLEAAVPGSIAVNPDGTELAVGMFDGTIRLLNADSGEERLLLTGHSALVTRLAFSPDGTRILSGSLDRTLRLWDAASGEQVLQIDSPGAILNVAYSPDGVYAASSSGDSDISAQAQSPVRDRTVRVWDLATGEEVQRFEPNSGFVRSVTFSPNGRVV